jgi:hypothetical protein
MAKRSNNAAELFPKPKQAVSNVTVPGFLFTTRRWGLTQGAAAALGAENHSIESYPS